MLVIPDASVILKWVLPTEGEPCYQEANELLLRFVRQEIEFLVPSLWFYEVANILSIKYPVFAVKQLNYLRQLQIPESSSHDHWVALAVQLVKENTISFYDAAYHAIAITRKGIMVTADKKYISKMQTYQHLAYLPEIA